MSISDALLLDPYPFEAWVALRPSKGSGTLNDPFGVTTAGDCLARYFGRIWEFGRLLIEDNVIELGTRKLNGDYGRSLGVFLFVVGNDPQFTGRQAVIRNNVIRHVDNGSDVNGYSRAMQVYRVKDVLIQNNIIRLDSSDAATQARAIAYLTSESAVRTSSNWTPAGNLIRGAMYVPPYTLTPELETTVQADLDDVLLASFLGGSL